MSTQSLPDLDFVQKISAAYGDFAYLKILTSLGFNSLFYSVTTAVPPNPTAQQLIDFPVLRGVRQTLDGSQVVLWDRTLNVWVDDGVAPTTVVTLKNAISAAQATYSYSTKAVLSADATIPNSIAAFVDNSRWLWSATGIANGGTVITAAAGGYRIREFNGRIYARWFGAKGDNVTDDTAAIQAALNYAATLGGATVWLDAGTYYLAAQLNMPDFVTLEGQTTGAGSTGPSGGYIPAAMLDGHGRTGALVSFPGTSVDAQVSSQYVQIRGIGFRSCQFGISGNATYYVARWIIQDCDFQASLTTGISANLFYAVIRDNMFGYHGAPVGGAHTGLAITGTNNLPANGNKIRDNRFYHCAGASGYHLLLNLAPATAMEGNIYEAGDSTSRHVSVINSDGCTFYQDWFEGALAPYLIEFGGTITTATFDHCTFVGTANTQALIGNSTGAYFQLNMLNNRYLGLYKFLNADNTVYRETRLTAGFAGFDVDMAAFNGPQPSQQTYRINLGNPRDFNTYLTSQVYPYPVVDRRAATTVRRGMVYRSAALTAPSPAYAAITAAATYTQIDEQALRDKVEALRVRLGDLETKLTAAGLLT